MAEKTAIIIGAGPAGLTAAYELLENTEIIPLVFEKSGDIGGISKTVNYKGNRIDIGGHRFFSKSDKVMQWWQNIMPVQGKPAKDDIILNRRIPLSEEEKAPDPEKDDAVMLIRNRVSRIFFLRSFFNYPISLKWNTFRNLGLIKIVKIGYSYLKIRIYPIKNEKNLEDFLINRFGKELYKLFFKDYTEKVWGVNCTEIKPEWGAQRIKGLSITKAIIHAVRSSFMSKKDIEQKKTETSLIEQFLYPKYGPGQLWEEVSKKIIEKGGKIYKNNEVIGVKLQDKKVINVKIKDSINHTEKEYNCDYLFSTMPVKELINIIYPAVPKKVLDVANGLVYRDFITVGLLLKRMKIKNETAVPTINDIVPDNWIYIQERDVKLGRLQIFNNWSPYLVKNSDNIWIGLEYFCNEDDELWRKSDEEFVRFAIDELVKIEIIDKKDVLDSTVIRMPKTYPAYFGAYNNFDVIREYTDKIDNLYLIGRNGMHKYNNADHSMLTAMLAVENIKKGIRSKNNIWDVNAEDVYHEEK